MAENVFKNIGIFGHAGSGKTTISDALLYRCGANTRFGKVSDKSSAFDTDPEEQERGFSLSLALATFDYKNTLINLIDTPGYSDFIGDAYSGLEAVDCAILVIDASAGVEAGTERLLSEIEKRKLPLIIFVNKLKKENTDFYKLIDTIGQSTKRSIVPLTIPIGTAAEFKGVVDILKSRAYGLEDKEEKIPDELKNMVEKYREKMIESAADIDDGLMNKYVEGEKIELGECLGPLKKGILDCKICLGLAGEAIDLIGIKGLIDVIMEFVPESAILPPIEIDGKKIELKSDGPFLGYVFKTMVEPHLGEICYLRVFSGQVKTGMVVKNTSKSLDEKINQILLIKGKEKKETNQLGAGMIGGLVKLKDTHTGDTLSSQSDLVLPPIKFPEPSISMAVVPRAKGDEEKISNGLTRLRDEDPTFAFNYDPEIKQLIISGIGELHLDVILSRLKRKYGVSVDLVKPKIKYRETFTRKVEAQGKYKKQTGGHGQYGDCWLRVEPLPRGTGFEFVNKIVGGAIPSRFIPSVEKGVKEALNQGFLAGFPITDIRVTVYDGSYHSVDSSDIAFKIAASMAMKANAQKGNMVLLEPINEVEVYVPEAYMGDVIGDLNSRRGKIMGMEAIGKVQLIKALVPEAEMYKYSTSLRSMTQGRGYFNMKFHHYEEVPREITQRIIEQTKREKKE